MTSSRIRGHDWATTPSIRSVHLLCSTSLVRPPALERLSDKDRLQAAFASAVRRAPKNSWPKSSFVTLG